MTVPSYEDVFRWLYAAVVREAKRELADNPWGSHEGHEWGDINGTSKSVYLHRARDTLGIPHSEFLALVRSGKVSDRILACSCERATL